MRIVELAAGAGQMYCGSCLQANTLVSALRVLNHEAYLVPLYTPLRTDEPCVGNDHLAFGALNVYLKEHFPIFRYAPPIFERIFDSPLLIRWLSQRSSRVNPRHLGTLTVSMLRGETGHHQRELTKLIGWLADQIRPEVVHLSNLLLAGLAREISRRLNVPVISSLAGEDLFLEGLPSPSREEALELIRHRANDLAMLIAPSDYYADFMSEYLEIARHRIAVIYPGMNLEGHGLQYVEKTTKTVTIGYLGRVCPAKGLHHLIDAWKILDEDRHSPPTNLRVAGYMDACDRSYFDNLRQCVKRWGMASRFEYVGEVDRDAKIEFLQSLRLVCLPTEYPDPKGLPVLEAWANGVPVVVPDHGVFPEMLASSGGGVLHEPGNPQSIASSMRQLIESEEAASLCGRRGQQIVRAQYNASTMAKNTLALYHRVLGLPE